MTAEGPHEDERDEAWLLARMRGEPAAHPDPERAEAYLRLERDLAALPAPRAPEGWQAKVLAAIDAPAGAGGAAPKPSPPRGGRLVRLRPIMPFAFAALAAAAFLLFLRPPPSTDKVAVSYRFEQAQTRAVPSGAQAAVGDTLLLEAEPGRGGELRVYRDRRELVLRCPGGEGCELASEGGRPVFRAKVPRMAPGRYRIVVLGGEKLPAPSGNEDQDLSAAMAAGAKVESASFVVR